jgi:hypothetical protein
MNDKDYGKIVSGTRMAGTASCATDRAERDLFFHVSALGGGICIGDSDKHHRPSVPPFPEEPVAKDAIRAASSPAALLLLAARAISPSCCGVVLAAGH